MSFASQTFNPNVLFINNETNLIINENVRYSSNYQQDELYRCLSYRQRPPRRYDRSDPAGADRGYDEPGGQAHELGHEFLLFAGQDWGDVPIDPPTDPPPPTASAVSPTQSLSAFPTPSTFTSTTSPQTSLTPQPNASTSDTPLLFGDALLYSDHSSPSILDFDPLPLGVPQSLVDFASCDEVASVRSPYAGSTGSLEDMGPEVIFPTPQEIPVPNFRTPCGGEENGDFELFAPLVEGAFCQDGFDDLYVPAERVTEDFDFVSFLDSIEEPVRGLDASPSHYDVSPSFTNDTDIVTDDHVVDLGFDFDAAAPLFGDVGAAGDMCFDDGSLPLFGDLASLSGVVAPQQQQHQNLVQEPTISIPISDLIRLLTAASAAGQSPALTSLPSPAPSPVLPPTATTKKATKAKAAKKPYDRPAAKKDEVQKTHRCPGEGCSKSFWRRDALRRHMEKNGCAGDLE